MTHPRASHDLVGVRLTRSGPVVFCDSAGLEPALHDRVLVAQDGGEAVGTVVVAPGQLIHSDLRVPAGQVLRKV
ncbi:MAG: hypothetical protein FJ315_04080 [SAR202 cluster bacterium]|nr:hypothetical protein [SAR202 cluster bacterium]